MNEETLLSHIEDLGLQAALQYLLQQGITFSKGGHDRIKKAIREKHQKKKYAFVPNKEEAQKIQDLSDHPDYTQFKLLLPDYRHIDLIRTGLLISFYHNRDDEGDERRVREIKSEISGRPNGDYLVEIVKLVPTPFFSLVLERLQHLKLEEDYSDEQLGEAFQEIVEKWEKNSKFIDRENTKTDVESFIHAQVNSKNFFFLLGIKSAAEMIEEVIKANEEENFFDRNNYTYKITKRAKGAKPRLEVMGWPKPYSPEEMAYE